MKREVLEETGIVAHVKGIIGVRSGVIRNEISDNMIIFLLEPEGENIIVQEKELSEVAFLHPDKIVDDPNTSVLIKYLLEGRSELHLEVDKTLNPVNHLVIQLITYLRHVRRRGKRVSIPVLLISMMLFFILFFGIGFLLNMILRATWVMVIVYPIVCMLIINKASMWDYFSKPKETFSSFGTSVSHLGQADVFILSTGLVGAALAGVVIKKLRKSGYQMF